ncbi:MAG: putative nucleotidyltransferase with HDIG domain [Alteromonadaceae bacterium]|jgi:putative nucleotidyltransferase with HDIG domain
MQDNYNTDPNSPKDIPISQLQIGMYVLSITTGQKNISIKSEGYISKAESIVKLTKSGVTRVVIDPSRTKESAKNTAKIELTAKINEVKIQQTTVSLDQEMKKSSQLYSAAKVLQKKILDDLTKQKTINIKEVQESTDAIVDSIFRNQDALSCMSRLRQKSDYLIEHALNVSILMTIFCKHLAIERTLIEQIALGAFLHDIGKVFIPDHILNKPGKYTADELEEMKKHVPLGVKILEDIPDISHIVMSMVKEHHERLNGQGYPYKLTGEAISKYGRMIAIVDSYDAMTAERIYKVSMHPIQAFKNLINEAPDSYDKELVEQFIQCLGLYPVGTLVKLNSGKLGLISKINHSKPLQPFVRVFYNTRLNQAIAMTEVDLSKPKNNDQIDYCIKPEEFNINLLGFFKAAFID